jgi:hypothetical protein
MPRSIGPRQRMALQALLMLEEEDPLQGDEMFAVWAFVRKLAQIDPELVARRNAMDDAAAARKAEIRRAAAGDEYVMMSQAYGAARRNMMEDRNREDMREDARWLETPINPSRLLDLLEKRGFVERWKRQGRGLVRLTDKGREMVGAEIQPTA